MEDEDKQLVKEITEPMAKVMSKHMNFLNELEAGKEQRKKAKDNGAAAEIEILRADRKIEKLVRERREAEGRRDEAKRCRNKAEEIIVKAGKEAEVMNKVMKHFSCLTRTHVDRAEKKKKQVGSGHR